MAALSATGLEHCRRVAGNAQTTVLKPGSSGARWTSSVLREPEPPPIRTRPGPPGHRSLEPAGVIRRVSVLNATARRLSLPEELAMATQMAARQQRGSVSRFISPFAPANHIRRGTREESQGQRVARGV